MPCNSMTGFGRAVHHGASVTVKVELRAVNHRFAEFNLKLPRDLSPLEEAIRNLLNAHIARGRVDLFINVDYLKTAAKRVVVDWELFGQLCRIEQQAKQIVSTVERPSGNDLGWLIYPDVIRVEAEEIDLDVIRPEIMTAIEDALKSFCHMREREGSRIEADMRVKIQVLERTVQCISERAPEVGKLMADRLKKRVLDVIGGSSLDEQRLMTEVAILLERQTIDEELVRLRSHIAEFISALQAGSPVGRKLDFLAQEMHREVNTIGSKANDMQIAKAVVDAKVVLEQLREQTQNLE